MLHWKTFVLLYCMKLCMCSINFEKEQSLNLSSCLHGYYIGLEHDILSDAASCRLTLKFAMT